MASSLELGPGIRLLAPSRSRNFSRVSHCRRRTSSSSMMAMCAAGPPNAVNPSRRKNAASSRRAATGAPLPVPVFEFAAVAIFVGRRTSECSALGQLFPAAPPGFPVLQGGLAHAFGGFVQPAIFALGQIALHILDCGWRAQMHIGGFKAHGVEQARLVALRGQGSQFDARAIRRQAAPSQRPWKMTK